MSGSGQSKGTVPLKCTFPPCNCETCRKLRDAGKENRMNCDNYKKNEEKPSEEVSIEHNFVSFLYDVVGIMALLIIVNTVFWISITQYTYRASRTIYFSDKQTKIITLICVLLLAASISYSVLTKEKAQPKGKKQIPPCKKAAEVQETPTVKATTPVKPPPPPPPPPVATMTAAPKPTPPPPKPKPQEPVTKPPSKSFFNFGSCFDKRRAAAAAAKKNVPTKMTVTIRDQDSREIFKQSRLHVIPTEMKQPPALLVYIRDQFFT